MLLHDLSADKLYYIFNLEQIKVDLNKTLLCENIDIVFYV